jgi:hypothetical protein
MQNTVDLPAAAADELTVPLASAGFSLLKSKANSVSYFRGSVMISFGFYPEDAAPRPLNIALGIITEGGGVRTVGAWELIPEDAIARRYSMWRFGDQSELRSTLRRVYREVVEDWLASYLGDPGRLEQAVTASEQGRYAAYDADHAERLLRKAREAFGEGRYQAALDSYAHARVDLKPTDLKRREIARRKLMQS